MKKIPNSKLVIMLGFWKYKIIFAKGYTSNWSEEVFVVSKIKNTVSWAYVISDLNGEEITGSFYENELPKTSQEKFWIEKVLKTKGDKLYVKWKGYDNSFNIWINKKDLVQKRVNTFLNRLEVLEEILTLKLICLIMQQKLI